MATLFQNFVLIVFGILLLIIVFGLPLALIYYLIKKARK